MSYEELRDDYELLALGIMTLAPDVPMPRSLRRRIVRSVGEERRNWRGISAWGAIMAAVLLVLGWFSLELFRKGEFSSTQVAVFWVVHL
jgi:ferric-dicitrate binding protein FerR (iron transport regulator)